MMALYRNVGLVKVSTPAAATVSTRYFPDAPGLFSEVSGTGAMAVFWNHFISTV
jgi:hypothetical protein